MTDPRQLTFPHRRSADQDRLRPAQHPVVIVGAGPVGLVAALELARKGHRTIVIDKKSNLSDGSRAICWAKRTLEIMDRLGLGDAIAAKGVTWKTGTVFFDTQRLFEFDLLPETAHRRPAFVNLQQYYFEHFCIEAARQTALIELRWQEEVQGLEPTSDGLLLTISTPTGAGTRASGAISRTAPATGGRVIAATTPAAIAANMVRRSTPVMVVC